MTDPKTEGQGIPERRRGDRPRKQWSVSTSAAGGPVNTLKADRPRKPREDFQLWHYCPQCGRPLDWERDPPDRQPGRFVCAGCGCAFHDATWREHKQEVGDV
jgi:hypothetical protein